MHLLVFDRRVQIDRIDVRRERTCHFIFHSRHVICDGRPIGPLLDGEFVCRRCIQRVYAPGEESRQLRLRINFREAALEQHAKIERRQMTFIKADGMPQRDRPHVKGFGGNQLENLPRSSANVAISFVQRLHHPSR